VLHSKILLFHLAVLVPLWHKEALFKPSNTVNVLFSTCMFYLKNNIIMFLEVVRLSE
jgi:hypothetical protein